MALLSSPGSWAVDTLVAARELPLVAPVGLPASSGAYACPYRLPSRDLERTGALLVVSSWLHGASGRDPTAACGILRDLKARVPRLLYLDHADPFRLCHRSEVLALPERVLKVNGVYLDAALHSLDLGACRGDGKWTPPGEPLGDPPRPETVAGLHLSIPCFIGTIPAVRYRVQRFYGRPWVARAGLRALELAGPPGLDREPPSAVHFRVTLTHVQRLAAARALTASGVPWVGGITSVPEEVTGAPTAEERRELGRRIEAEGLLAPRLPRLAYSREIHSCKAVVSVTGYGELCFRMAEAWANRRVLVCQDISHVRTLFPFRPGENVVYCRPDLADLADIARDIHHNWRRYRPIAERGHRDWRAWSARWQEWVRTGFAPVYDVCFPERSGVA